MKTKLLHAALFTPLARGNKLQRWGLPLLLWGKPGIGKTEVSEAIGSATALHVETLSPGERGEGGFGVTPMPSENGLGTYLTYPPPEWVRDLIGDKDGFDEQRAAVVGDVAKITHKMWARIAELTASMESGIIFVDETNTAPPALQPALLGLIQARRVGGHQCGPRVRVLGAANPVGQTAGGWDLAASVANRLGHIDWLAPEVDEWGPWLLGVDSTFESVDALQEEARVLSEWPEAYAWSSGLIYSFLSRRPELLEQMPPDGDPAQSRAWPSPRTWFYATCAMAGSKIHGLDELETDELVAAFVGSAAAGELITWIEEQDLPGPAELLDGKVEWKHDPARLDRTDAVLKSCTALVIPGDADKRDERVKALWGVLAGVMRDAKDLCYTPMKALAKAGLQKTTEARPVLAALDPLREATKGLV